MVIDVSKLREGDIRSDAVTVRLRDNVLSSHGGRFVGDVSYTYDLVMMSDNEVALSGETRYEAVFVCDRCGEEFTREITNGLSVIYTLNPDGDEYYYDGNNIDVTPAIRDSVILDLPMSMVCREDCESLTHVDDSESDNPFAVLKEKFNAGGAE
jgi:uncharacterized metal-binding protein YceD (DUF177 family)